MTRHKIVYKINAQLNRILKLFKIFTMRLPNYFCRKSELRVGATVAAVFSWFIALVAVVVAVILLAGVAIVHKKELDEFEEVALRTLQILGGIYSTAAVIAFGTSLIFSYGIYRESRRLIFVWLTGDILIQTVLSTTTMFAVALRYWWFLSVFPVIGWKIYLWIIALSFYVQLGNDEIPVTSHSECEGPTRHITTISEEITRA